MPAKATTSSTARRSRFSLVLRWQAMAAGQRPRPRAQGTPQTRVRPRGRGHGGTPPATLLPCRDGHRDLWCPPYLMCPGAGAGTCLCPQVHPPWVLRRHLRGRRDGGCSRDSPTRWHHGVAMAPAGGRSDGQRVVGTGHGQGGGCSTATVAPGTRWPRGAGSGAHSSLLQLPGVLRCHPRHLQLPLGRGAARRPSPCAAHLWVRSPWHCRPHGPAARTRPGGGQDVPGAPRHSRGPTAPLRARPRCRLASPGYLTGRRRPGDHPPAPGPAVGRSPVAAAAPCPQPPGSAPRSPGTGGTRGHGPVPVPVPFAGLLR